MWLSWITNTVVSTLLSPINIQSGFCEAHVKKLKIIFRINSCSHPAVQVSDAESHAKWTTPGLQLLLSSAVEMCALRLL